MSRTSALPTAFATVPDMERGFLHQVRRFRRACDSLARPRPETAAPIVLSAPGLDAPRGGRVPRTAEEDADHARLELLRSQTILLQNMSGQILTNFPGDARAARLRQSVETMLRSVEERAEQLRTRLGTAARRQVDRTVVVRNHMLMQQLTKNLKHNVGGITEMYLVGDVQLPGMHGEPVRAEVAYLRLTDLRGPDGFVHPSYYVCTAHPTGAGNGRLANMYLSAGPDYRTPGRVRWTATAKSPQELLRVALDMLVGEGVVGRAFERDLPIPPGSVAFTHDNVRKTEVKGNLIRVTVRDKSLIEETRGDIRRQLTSIVRQIDPRNRDVIRDRVEPARGLITLQFSLPGNLRGRILDPGTMRKLAQVLDLDPATLQRVRSAIENPE